MKININIYGLHYPEIISMKEKLQKMRCNICRNVNTRRIGTRKIKFTLIINKQVYKRPKCTNKIEVLAIYETLFWIFGNQPSYIGKESTLCGKHCWLPSPYPSSLPSFFISPQSLGSTGDHVT